MIKYLGSKRRLVPAIGAMYEAAGGGRALDLFTGTTRVAQDLKRRGGHVTAVDVTRCSAVLARCYIATDARAIDAHDLAAVVAALDALPGRPGYVTETFCRTARYFQPHNGARIDAIRAAIERDHAGSPLEPVLLTSLLEAADRVDSTTGVQMAFVKQWSTRSHQDLRLRVPELLAGAGTAVRADAVELAGRLPTVEFAYLDPPYNQHRYDANYHVWETLVASDEPEHYGVACKRIDLRDRDRRSAFNSRRTMPDALARVVAEVDAETLVLSYNDESWVPLDDLVAMCARRGHVAVVAFDSKRYVGALIGVHNPRGERVGTPGRTRNVEYLVVSGDPGRVERAARAAVAAGAGRRMDVDGGVVVTDHG